MSITDLDLKRSVKNADAKVIQEVSALTFAILMSLYTVNVIIT